MLRGGIARDKLGSLFKRSRVSPRQIKLMVNKMSTEEFKLNVVKMIQELGVNYGVDARLAKHVKVREMAIAKQNVLNFIASKIGAMPTTELPRPPKNCPNCGEEIL